MITGREQARDVASLAVKTVVAELEPAHASVLVHTAVPKLIAALKSDHTDVVLNSLDTLTELTSRYGNQLPSPSALQAALSAELEGRAAVRKRAVHCLAVLAAALPPDPLDALCVELLDRLDAAPASASDTSRTYVQALAALSRTIGYKLGPHLPRAVPLCCARLRAASEADDESRRGVSPGVGGFCAAGTGGV